MSQQPWRLAAAYLSEATKSASHLQQQVAAVAKISIKRGTPRIVAAAQLRAALANELHVKPARPAGASSLEWIRHLFAGNAKPPAPQTQEEASAWIEHLYLVRRRRALISLQPEIGDVVVGADGNYAEISSISANGRIHYIGGLGQGAWPDEVELAAHVTDTSSRAERLRLAARNAAASRRPKADWSYARAQDLRDFIVEGAPAAGDLLALEEVVARAKDERPIQKFLEDHPALLALLIPREECYVLPQKRLGSEYVPDFVMGDVDSVGIHWHLVELESPRARMFTQDGKGLTKEARKGVDQIVEWRDWLHTNVAYARTRRSEHGLGLFGIRADAPGLVLIGRRANLTNHSEAIRHQWRTSNIHIHTYDWLLETIRGSLGFSGPAAMNPFAFSRK